MALLKFRVYLEDDFGVYRDIVIKHTQNFEQLHSSILDAYGFDHKHQATFYRSNDAWLHGREISLAKYDKVYRTEPLLMSETIIGSEIRDTNQHFIYEYDFVKNWVFQLELINVNKDESRDKEFPYVSRVEGIGPQQYGVGNVLNNQFLDIEEKYDLNKDSEGFGEEGDSPDTENEEEQGEESETNDF
ncbi:IS1096 element passenger TnpR family protein [Arachidicoccus sp.]|uniref:IS1096 element passenger TnpR family protein n=1 Tax=Arachidicoccus sp. TaxID=1872624 RepID=UPI003D23A8A4